VLPTEWSGSLSANLLVIAPGEMKPITCTITSSVDALAKSYGIGVDVWDEFEAIHDRTAMATYNVIEPEPEDTTPPTSPSRLKGSSRRNKVQLSWSPSTDDTAVAGYVVFRDEQFIATTTNTKYDDFNASSGMHTYKVIAEDMAGNESLPSSVSVKAR